MKVDKVSVNYAKKINFRAKKDKIDAKIVGRISIKISMDNPIVKTAILVAM